MSSPRSKRVSEKDFGESTSRFGAGGGGRLRETGTATDRRRPDAGTGASRIRADAAARKSAPALRSAASNRAQHGCAQLALAGSRGRTNRLRSLQAGRRAAEGARRSVGAHEANLGGKTKRI